MLIVWIHTVPPIQMIYHNDERDEYVKIKCGYQVSSATGYCLKIVYNEGANLTANLTANI
ncbi:hypothetical protein KTH_41050 [Thermosporothrix hazakensis]|nr:hypothetical protein KTH_41050 [Thermosporothrix hazakensis]